MVAVSRVDGRSRRPALPGTHAIVLERWKVLYLLTPKAACTSLLWLFASLQREPLGAIRTSRAPEVTRATVIHDFGVWRHTRTLRKLTATEWRPIADSGDWLVFCVTRHPLTRLWSAWQSKLLLREPYYVQHYGDRAWFPRTPQDVGEIGQDFRSFVDALRDEPGLLEENSHWRPQSALLKPEAFPYTHVGRVEELPDTLRVLSAHLRGQGWEGTLTAPRENASPLPLSLAPLAAGTARAVERVYGHDLRQFGYASMASALGRPQQPASDTDLLLRSVRMIIERNERIGDLCGAATRQSAWGS